MKLLRSSDEFENDLREMLQAFFPEEVITSQLFSGERPEEDEAYAWIREEDKRITVELLLPDGFRAVETMPLQRAGLTRAEEKTLTKGFFYDVLEKHQGALPWGSLTGIRPAYLAVRMLKEGKSEEEVRRCFREDYRVSDEKTSLAVFLAKKEEALLGDLKLDDSISIYVGVPFCPSICAYCSFSAYPLARYSKKVDAYVEALLREIRETAPLFRGRKVTSFYMGGGTPTTLSEDHMELVMRELEANYDFSQIREKTVEAGRPDSLSPSKLRRLKDLSIDRISINPQTMNQKTLDRIGRRHTVEEVIEAVSWARDAGFRNLNMDLILGLPGETEEDILHTYEEIRRLRPESLTIHALAVKRAARLKREETERRALLRSEADLWMDGAYRLAEELNLEAYYLYRQKQMAGNLENIGFSLPGAECLYNLLMMQERESILAFGAGASSKKITGDRVEHIFNVKDVDQYIQRIDEMTERKRSAFG